jgi:hypothetical protein
MPTSAQLFSEISTDPKNLGLAALTDDLCADKLNEVGASSEVINRSLVPAFEIEAALVSSDEDVLTPNEQSQLIALLTPGEVDINDAEVQSKLNDLFNGTTTRTNLIALETRNASRAEVLWGAGINISLIDVHIARRI